MGALSGRRVALVGGAGFIGHHLALKLKDLGAEVFVIDSLAVNNYHSFKNNVNAIPSSEVYLSIIQQRLDLLQEKCVTLTELDSRDYIKLTEVIKVMDVDTLLHLAACEHADR